MEENNENKNNTEEVKEEAKNESKTVSETISETVSEVKEATKNTNSKESVAMAKNFLKNIFTKPYSEMKEIAANHKPFLVIAIIILAVWVVAGLIDGIISVANMYSLGSYYTLEGFMRNSVSSVFTIISSILIPVIIVALLSGIIYIFMKDKKKNFLAVVIAVVVAKLPVVVASIISLLSSVGSEVAKITSAFSGFCGVLSTVLLYFAIKALYKEEDDDKVTIKFIITMAIYYGVALVLSFFKLYI